MQHGKEICKKKKKKCVKMLMMAGETPFVQGFEKRWYVSKTVKDVYDLDNLKGESRAFWACVCVCVFILWGINITTDYLPFFLIISLPLSIGKGRRYQGEERLFVGEQMESLLLCPPTSWPTPTALSVY